MLIALYGKGVCFVQVIADHVEGINPNQSERQVENNYFCSSGCDVKYKCCFLGVRIKTSRLS